MEAKGGDARINVISYNMLNHLPFTIKPSSIIVLCIFIHTNG